LNSEWYLAYLDTSQFPTNPTVLQKYMNKYFGITGGATTTFFIAGNMLQEGASPALRAALFKLVEQLPGVALIPHAHDAMGRSGVGVVLNEKQHGLRHVLVFDPKSSAVLGEEDFVGPGKFASRVISVPRGTLVGFTEYGPTAVVASTSVVSR
jgi:hypothetical protein